MKNKFPEYYRPNLSKIWDECVFIFDTNVLIDLYYKKNIYSDFIDILENKIADRIWMPHQVGLEFHNHCFDPIKNKEKEYYEYIGSLKGVKTQIKKNYQKLSENDHVIKLNDYMDINNFNVQMESLNLSIDEMIKIMGENHDFFDGDNLRKKLDLIFNGKIGDCYQEDRLKEIYKEGNERYSNKIPPGFKDDKYGDLIIWHQIMDFSKNNNKSIIFVTQDSKIDWWFKSKSGDALMPHPHLIREFSSMTNQNIYLYNFSDFLNNANSYLDANVNSDTIESVKGIEKHAEFIDFIDFKDKGPKFSYMDKYGTYVDTYDKFRLDPNIKFRNIEVLDRIGPAVTILLNFYTRERVVPINRELVNLKLDRYDWMMASSDIEFEVDYPDKWHAIIKMKINHIMSKWEEIDDVVEYIRNKYVDDFIRYWETDTSKIN